MAHALSISDGTTTVSLSGTNFFLIHYVPNTPSYRNGVYDNVVDNISIMTDTASGSASQTAINSVEKLFDAARRRQETHTGPRVYLQLQLDSDSNTWRSELLMGSVVLEDGSLRAWTGKVPITLVVTRVHFWEDDAATLVSASSLTNAPGSNSVYTTTTVTGSLPTPAIVKLTNNSGATQYPRDVYTGINAFNDPATWTGALGSVAFSQSPPFVFGIDFADWNLSDAQLTAMRGDSFRFAITFDNTNNDDMWWRMNQYYDTVFYQGNTQAIYPEFGLGILDLLEMAVPISGYNTTGTGITLRLTGQSTVESPNNTVTGQMFPSNNFRKLAAIDHLAANEVLVDDPVEGASYVLSGSNRLPLLSGSGNPLLLYPGENHRFIWLVRDTTYDAADTCSVNITYRPRRLTV